MQTKIQFVVALALCLTAASVVAQDSGAGVVAANPNAPIMSAPLGTNSPSSTSDSTSLAGNLPSSPLLVHVTVGGKPALLKFNRAMLLQKLGQFRSTYEFDGEPLASVLAGLAKILGCGFQLPMSNKADLKAVQMPVYARYVNQTPEQVFNAVAKSAGFVVRFDGSTYTLMSPDDIPPSDLVLRVYETKYVNIYNYVDAIKALLSPAGKLVSNAALAAKGGIKVASGGDIVSSQQSSGSSGGGGSGSIVGSVSSDSSQRDAAMPLNSFSISVLDIPEVQARIAKFLQSVDHPMPQIAVTMRLFEFTSTKDPSGNSEGIDWSKILNNATISGPNIADPGVPFSFDSSLLQPGGVNFSGANNFLIQGPELQATIHALETVAKGRLLEAPNIIAQHGVTAILRSVERVPYLSGTVSSSSSGSSTAVQGISFANIGTTLNVTPFIENDTDPNPANWSLYLDLKPEITVQGPNIVINGNPVPSFSVRAPTTQVRMLNGDTVFIGGITEQSVQDSWSGVPGLSKVPFLKYIFGTRSQGNTQREMAMLVTARIIDLGQKALPVVQDPKFRRMLQSEYTQSPYAVVPSHTSMNSPVYDANALMNQGPTAPSAPAPVDQARLRQIAAERDQLEAERAKKFEQITQDFAKREAALNAAQRQAQGD